MESKKYTAKEILYNIEALNDRVDLLKLERTGISKDINSVKKQVLFWENMNENQCKMF